MVVGDKTLERDVEPKSYEAEVDSDARAAYAEVAGRIKEAKGSEPSTTASDKGGEGPASRSSTTKVTEKPETRDDGRDEKGRFAGKAGDEKPDPAVVGDKTAAAATAPKPDDKTEPAAAAQPVAGGPPPSFSVATKAEWDKLPAHVRADIVKRESEMAQGLSALRDFKDLKPYQEMAQRHNTTIPKALDHFVRMEQMIRQNPAAGMAQIAVNMGMSQAQAAEMFGSLAQRFGGQASGQPGAPQGANGQPVDPLTEALSPVLNQLLGPLMKQVEALKGQVSSREQADRNAQEQSLLTDINKFAADPANRFYPDLAEHMTKLMENGMVPKSGNNMTDLKAAYDLAARMHPEVSEALIEQRLQAKADVQRRTEQEAVDKAKGASRSLTGSKVPGTTIKERADGAGSYDDDLAADVRKAYRQHAGA